ncbi:vomeronasal type-2 receptor 1-like [Mantella aurantiaca]
MYPNFFRTVPDDEMQYVAVVKLLERLKWNWVGIITSDDEYGEREIRQLSKHLTNHGICIEFKILASDKNYERIPPELLTSTTEVIIICGSVSLTYYRFLLNNTPYCMNKTFILPDSWSLREMSFSFSNSSLVFSCPYFIISALQQYFENFKPSSHPDDPLLEDILITQCRCFSKNRMKNFLIRHTIAHDLRICDLETVSIDLNFEDKTPYRVYIAVHIMAQALHDMYFSLKMSNKKINSHEIKYKLSRYLKEVHYRDPNGMDMNFNDKGELPTYLGILNWIIQDEGEDRIYNYGKFVGLFDGSFPEDQQLTLNLDLISWKDDKLMSSLWEGPHFDGSLSVSRGRKSQGVDALRNVFQGPEKPSEKDITHVVIIALRVQKEKYQTILKAYKHL